MTLSQLMVIIGAVGSISSALSALFMGLSKAFPATPWLAAAAKAFGVVGLDFSKIGGVAVLALALSFGAAACTPAEVSTAVSAVPVLVGVACQLASDQGSAEPGWEVSVCNVLDPTGKATGASFLVKHKAGQPPKTMTLNAAQTVALHAR